MDTLEPEQQDSALEELLAYCQENGRVVPLPLIWKQLYEQLPNRRQQPAGGWEPALPLILGAWHHSSGREKRQRLREHLRWAATNGGLERAAQLLKGLAEDDWYHEAD